MKIRVVGLNHKSAPVDVREKLAFNSEQVTEALEQLKSRFPEGEFLLLSTCNRTELYHAANDDHLPELDDLIGFLGEFCSVSPDAFRDYLYVQNDEQAANHLLTVASSLDSLAEVYLSQGQHAKAEPLGKRALAIRENVLGPDHPHVASSLNTLASIYKDQGQHAKAEPLFKRALAITESVMGPDHHHVGMILEQLAELYRATDRGEKAEPLEQRAARIRANLDETSG